jgi:hypothetical protein
MRLAIIEREATRQSQQQLFLLGSWLSVAPDIAQMKSWKFSRDFTKIFWQTQIHVFRTSKFSLTSS